MEAWWFRRTSSTAWPRYRSRIDDSSDLPSGWDPYGNRRHADDRHPAADQGLRRRPGLNDLDLEVGAGEVFGFLGPNGAGKTTTIRLLMGMIRPSGGSARVFGLDCQREAVAVKRLVGYVPGELPDWGRLRGSEITASLAALRGGVDTAYVAGLCGRLERDLGRRWRELS